MSTTTIRLPEDLKSRVAAAASQAGTSTHSFIIQAIAEKTREQELAAEFDELADARYAQFLTDGKAIPWKDLKDFLEKRIAGDTTAVRPKAKKLAR